MSNAKSIVNVSGACFDYVRVNSDGLWNVKHGETILQHSFFRFQVQLLLMIFIAHTFHFLMKSLHFPRITSHVLAGIILGPSFLGQFFPQESGKMFPPVPNQVFGSLLKTGFIFYVFLESVRMDVSLVRKIGKRCHILGVLVFVFPYTMANTIDVKFDPKVPMTLPGSSARINNSKLYFRTMCNSQFVNVSSILMHLNITNSRLGHIALASTLLVDVLSFFYSIGNFQVYLFTTAVNLGLNSLFFALLFYSFILIVLRRAIYWFIKKTPEGKQMNELYTTFVMAMVLILSSLGDTVGFDYLSGPTLLGLLIPPRSPLATMLISRLDVLVTGLFMPLLATLCATKFDIWLFFVHFEDMNNFKISLIGHLFKLVATYFMVLLVKVSYKEALALTLLLSTKGYVEFGTFLSYTPLESNDLDSASGIFLICLLASYSAPLIRLLYDPKKQYIGYVKKSVQYSPSDSELGILVCAQKQDEALAAMKILQISNPTKQTPLCITGLCLEDLIGRPNPILINHQLGQITSYDYEGSHTQSIVDVFRYFKLEHKNLSQVNCYTAISPIKQMHEDICWLAFTKGCSFIILPFHKKWNNKMKLVSSSNDLRALNNNVLERAPCSVGILIDRRENRSLSSIIAQTTKYRVGVLFIGGPDDREALAYGLRIAKSPNIQLSVICFMTPNSNHGHDRWETMLDNESLRAAKLEMAMNSSIVYMEETVRDGSDTAAIVQSIHANYDLMLVGRLHESEPEAISGLKQWTELPELGPIGDLLASPDITSPVSVMVVQQQILQANHSSILN